MYMEFQNKQMYNFLFFTIQIFIFCIKKYIKFTYFYHTLHFSVNIEFQILPK